MDAPCEPQCGDTYLLESTFRQLLFTAEAAQPALPVARDRVRVRFTRAPACRGRDWSRIASLSPRDGAGTLAASGRKQRALMSGYQEVSVSAC